MEILIHLDRVEPPAGRLRLLPESEEPPGAGDGDGIGFAGWLGLLRALDEVIGPSDERPSEAG
jgi:hypothetical protein